MLVFLVLVSLQSTHIVKNILLDIKKYFISSIYLDIVR